MKDSSSSLFLAFLMRFLSRQLYSQAQMPRLMERRQPRISITFKSFVTAVSSDLLNNDVQQVRVQISRVGHSVM